MKKILFFVSALAGLFFAASCQQEEFAPVEESNVVTFEVGIPEVATKAVVDDGTNINDLAYAVYRTAAETKEAAQMANDLQLFYQKNYPEVLFDNGSTTIPIELINDQNYLIVFWAQVNDAWVKNEFDPVKNGNITYPKDMSANNSGLAAFTNVAFLSADEIKGGAIKRGVELKRPFAQINIGTTLPTNVKENVVLSQSYVKVTGAGASFDPIKQAVSKEITDVVFAAADVPGGSLKVNDLYYKYAAMNYIFAKGNVGVAFKIVTEAHGTVTTEEIPQVPVQTNYRTNIVGNLLTSEAEYSVTLDNTWGTPDLAADPIYLAAAIGGEVTLTEDVVLTSPLEVKAEMTINLNGKTIRGAMEKGNGSVVNIAEGVSAKLIGGTIENTAANGDAVINNAGNLVLNGVEIKGAPLADGGYSAYAVISSGNMIIEEGTAISADRGSIKVTGAGETIINGGTFTNNDIGSRTLTSHVVDVEDGSTHKLTINGGTFQHLHTSTSGGVVICNRTRGTVYVNGGNFSGGNYLGNNNLSDYGYGGTFSVKGGVFSANPAAKYIAAGYKSIAIGTNYHVLPEVVANAAESAGVTAVTENTAEVATALATDNGEATMFMWNDVAYIAKYGEVVIASSADEATTVRGVVESAAGLKSATVVEGIEVVGNRTFRKCANLETVQLPNTLTEIGPAVFQSCSKLANVTIPTSVTTIGEGAFAECTSLTSINIPEGITRLEKDVLRNTGLTSIEIPASVNYIGTHAFRDCESLTEVTILSPEFTIENNTFTNMAAPVPTMTIYVVNTEMKTYLESILTNYDKSYITVVVPGVVSKSEELKEALADPSKDIITLASGTTFEGVFEVNRGVSIVSERPDNKSTIKGRVNVKGNNVTDVSFTNVAFAVNEESEKVWSSGGSVVTQKPSIVMSDVGNVKFSFENCDFALSTRAYAYTNASGAYSVFNNCTFNGAFNYAMYVRANIEITNCTYNTTVTNVLVGACVNNLTNGKVVFVNNSLPNGNSIGLAGAVVFCSTNNEGGKWAGPVEFTVRDNEGFAYAYERMGDFPVNSEDHTFTEGSETFSF